MSNKLRWTDYLNRLPGNPSDRAIAQAINVNPSTISRWRGGQDPTPMHVTKVARAFEQDPLSALVNAGYLTLDEADSLLHGDSEITVQAIGDYSNLELASELARRLREEDEGN